MGTQIAIDGPAGAGKSTIAKRISKEKGFIYVDTGAMYRALALFMLENNIPVQDEAAVGAAVKDADVELKFIDGVQRVFLNGKDVSTDIRKEETGNAASVTSVYAVVRQYLTALQKKIASENDVVMDGRDIGTVVLPNAQLKIFLTASVDCRAKRRFDELAAKGETPDLEKIKADIVERDERDSSRANAPLKQAEDAVLVDTSDLDIDGVTARILSLCADKGI